ncbi:MAG: glycosyltransferase family 4 protein [Drouetiella hepatica Uher 2000/2452]|jgi:glycosyltransferase involved in cell wall biosynthesis|uniref:Glycosyltransferase family 4 protein n=1 Tax=Drouetiella hepatica Uher 2000/2452 TaxID=904376 RepID=A0A951UMI8_9CYAN|nr:glycosyltransferase family 4 protein [Drouetiella hepatica Uher 2000/2452]
MRERNGVTVNLSLVGVKPTGLATYARNLIPHLSLPITLLASAAFPEAESAAYNRREIPANLTAEQGKLGHLRRLIWTQQQLPRICAELRSPLLFSPVPEAPLWSQKIPAVVVVHDLIPLRFPQWTSPLTQYSRYYVPQVLAQAEHIICNSAATAQDIVDYFHIPAKKITPILLAHDASHFKVPESSASENHALRSDRPYFFYIGRPDPYKNLHRIISAFAALSKDSAQDYDLWIAGSRDRRYTPLLQAQADELAVGNRVKFLDYVAYQDLPQLMRGAIGLVFPSLWEGFGFPVLEAMACGTPVITSNLSSLPEVAGDAALLVNPYREAEIAAAMQTLIDDEGTRSQLQTAGLARASQFSWQKTGQATTELLSQHL